MPSTSSNVLRILSIVNRDGCIYLISKTEREVVTVRYNRRFGNDDAVGHLAFVYETRTKAFIPPNPVRITTGGAKAYLMA